jgi:comEA protein
MRFLDRFNQLFGFTRNESFVIMFLIFSFLAGMGIKFFKNTTISKQNFDYSASDSEFTRLSESSIDDLTDTAVTQADEFSNYESSSNKKISEANIQTLSININTATKNELTKLPGLGETLAGRVILYRKENGPFQKLEDLMNVRGIGEKKFERIKPFCFLK